MILVCQCVSSHIHRHPTWRMRLDFEPVPHPPPRKRKVSACARPKTQHRQQQVEADLRFFKNDSCNHEPNEKSRVTASNAVGGSNSRHRDEPRDNAGIVSVTFPRSSTLLQPSSRQVCRRWGGKGEHCLAQHLKKIRQEVRNIH